MASFGAILMERSYGRPLATLLLDIVKRVRLSMDRCFVICSGCTKASVGDIDPTLCCILGSLNLQLNSHLIKLHEPNQ